MKIVNDSVDEVRRQEQKDRPELFRSRYIWLKNPENLKESQSKTLDNLTVKKLNLKTSRLHYKTSLGRRVLQWFKLYINNGILEGINSLIQAAKARVRGYLTKKNLIAIIYMIGGKLNFGLPT